MERISAYVSEGEPVGSVQKPVAPVVDVDGTAVFALDKLFAGVELSADEVAARRGEDGELSVREGYGGTVVHEQRAFVRRVIGGKEGFDAKRLPLGIFVGAGDQSDGEDGFVYRAGEQSYSEFVIPFGEGETVVADVAAELVTVIFCSGEFGEQGRPRRWRWWRRVRSGCSPRRW